MNILLKHVPASGYAAPRTRLTSQGQTSIPAEMRKALRIEPGTELAWTIAGGHLVAKPVRATTLKDLQSAIQPSGLHLSIEDMDQAIRNHFKAPR